MKRSMLLGVIAAMAASCTVQEADVLMDEKIAPIFYATFEQPEEDTKVYANEQLLIRWHEDDRVSIFNKLTYNQQYQFTGKTGDKTGDFQKVEGDGYVTGNTINDIVAVYPYQQGTSIAEDEALSVELPADQVYAQNSFGRGTNTMVSVTSGNVLMFKNVGAYLMFSLYGEDISVSSITLKGNNGEKLSGKAYVTMPLNDVPSTQVVGDATDASSAITLRCETPVALNASAAECTEFWFVVPPVTFSRGFTITITQANGGTVEKSTSRSVSLTRNKRSRMEPVVVEKAALPEPEMVDLGLSVMWATCNVGASSPEEYGDYFAWGETEPKTDYSWATYKWSNGNSWLTKYNTDSLYGSVDFMTALESQDDAARANLGGSWRMPTEVEVEELISNCTITPVEDYNGSGVNGCVITSNVSGYTDKYIFLPFAGGRDNDVILGIGQGCFCWSSCSTASYPGALGNAAALVIGVENDTKIVWCSGYYRYYGFSVRPVYGEFIPVASVSLEPSTLELKVGESYTLSVTISPSNATEKTIRLSSSDESVAVVDANGLVYAAGTGTATITAYGSSGVSAECTVTVGVEAVPLSVPDDVEAVDLGLPSGLKWATCNVGASKPEQYGAYFAWGETEPKSNYSWSTYKYELGTGYQGPFSKYVTNSSYGTVDNNTVLDPEDDAAHVNWCGTWRMPTLVEWQELFDNCTWTSTSENGVNGRKVTGPNGNSIFLPAAGSRSSTNLNDAGSYGYYWSSSLNTDYSDRACLVGFSSDNFKWGYSYDDRYYGFSVRPVS